MVKRIIKYPNPSLRIPTAPVVIPSADLQPHIVDLLDTLATEAGGLAIASNQIMERGVRLFVASDRVDLGHNIKFGAIVNPTWNPVGNNALIQREGCLSFPGLTFDIPRYERISTTFFDVDGVMYTKEFEGLIARMFQHECDHLDGKLFIEMLPKKAQLNIRNIVIARKKAGKW